MFEKFKGGAVMAVKFICDRCNEEIDPYSPAGVIRFGVATLCDFSELDDRAVNSTHTTFLLCNSCKHDFGIFLGTDKRGGSNE